MARTDCEITTENFRSTCRVCLEEPHPEQMLDMSLIYDDDAQLTYYDCYEICAKENLRNCGALEPNTICKHCGVELQWAYEFYKKTSVAKEQLKMMRTIMDLKTDLDVASDSVKQENVKQSQEQQPQTVKDQLANDTKISQTSQKVQCERIKKIVKRQSYSEKFICPHCKKTFRSFNNMQKHQLSHMADRPQLAVDTKHKKLHSACVICNKVFTVAKALEVHMRYHNGDCPFKCNQCDRKFAQSAELTIHQQVWHTSSRVLCTFPNCGRFFTSSATLRSHKKTHNEKFFKCNACHLGFASRLKLKQHALVKHNMELTLEQLNNMQKPHVKRSKRLQFKLKTKKEENKGPDKC